MLEDVGKPVNIHEVQHGVVGEVIEVLGELHRAATTAQEAGESFCVASFLESC